MESPQETLEPVHPHLCHWPGCKQEVPPALWGCKEHWFKLPYAIRLRIVSTYTPGQEETKNPSLEYIAAAMRAQEWIAEKGQKR
jgi:hypothetical protein